MKIQNILIIAGVIILSLLFSFIGGCQYRKKTFHCPPVQTNTVLIHDTVTHEIPVDHWHYSQHTDTLLLPTFIPVDVDTVAILKDFFAVHIIDREWKDSLINVFLRDSITRNGVRPGMFRYKILRPQTVITNMVDNSVHYGKYLYIGLDVPIRDVNYVEVEGIFGTDRFYIGAGYTPQLKSFDVKLGARILKFKN